MCNQNLLPNVTSVIEEVSKVHKEKMQVVENEIKLFRNLFKCVPNNSRTVNHLAGYSKQKLSQHRKTSLDSPKPKPKQQTLRNSFSPVHSNNSTISSDRCTDENTCPEAMFCKLDHYIKKGLANDLKDCIRSVEEYNQFRQNPDKRSELERQKHLLRVENSWEEEFKTFQIFEPDLAECLFKYLSVMEVKEREPEVSLWLNNKLMNSEKVTEEAEQFLEEAQDKIIDALCEDLNNIDLEEIKSERNLSMAVKLTETVIALSNIRCPRTPVFFKNEACHDPLLEGIII